MARFLISAAHKSSGKTSIAIGLCAALRARGQSVQPFKKGPDYIDPLWLARAAERSCHNLDFQNMAHDEIAGLYATHAARADVVLVEGNKGLYDGMDVEGSNSNAALAHLLGLPVVLVLDVRGTIRGVAPLLLGYQAFDPELRIAGVILNQVGGARHEAKLRAVIARYTDIPVLGAVQRDPALAIDQRHLGLIPANEAPSADARIAALADAVTRQVDLDALLAATADGPLPRAAPATAPPASGPRVRIGIARDAAFGFYYTGDLEALERAGAELVPFDTLHDQTLPPVDGLFIGGGFPETQMAALAANRSLRKEILTALAAGMPAYAECGGLMYLARTIHWRGETHDMVGAIPGDVVLEERPVGRGYVRLRETADAPWPHPEGAGEPAAFYAHEFHHSRLLGLPDDSTYAYVVERGHGIDGERDGLVVGNLMASYAHLRDVAGHRWAGRFVAFVRERMLSAAAAAT